MATEVGIRVKVEGEASFKSAVKAMDAQIRELNAQMKAAVSSMDSMESQEYALSQKTKILNSTIDQNKERLALLTKQYAKAKEELDRLGTEVDKATDATAADKAANAYNKQAQEVARLGRQMAETENAINKASTELKNAGTVSDLYAKRTKEAAERTKEFGKEMSKAGQNISKVGSSMTKYLTTPVLAAGVAGVKFASDYEENLNKVDASFKDSAQVIKDWAKTATEQFGMSESAALEATSLFGDMGTSMGLTTAQAADMSTNLAGLAGDLASFKNIGIDQAMTALKGVFTGETESIKELGVVLTETNLKEFAKGLGLVYDEMSQTERVTLRYKYVLDKTKNAQGDYARTADETANSFRTLKSSVENLGAAFGQEILPTITPLIQGATDLIQKFGELDEETKQNIIRVGLFAAAIGPVLSVGGKLTDGLGKLIVKSGELRANLAGGTGLGSALLSTLGTTGKAGLAIAGVAGVTAAAIALGEAIHNATDPMIQMKKHLQAVSEAQNDLANAQSIIDLCNQYEELRARTADTAMSSDELSSVQDQLSQVRQALSEATDGAITTEGEYNDALDNTVETQKMLSEAEKQRANMEIYTELVAGSRDYVKALEDQKLKRHEIARASEYVEIYEKNLTEAVAKSTKELEDNGKASYWTSLQLEQAGKTANVAQRSYNDLVAELEEMEAASRETETSIIGLVQDGLLDAASAATLLGRSEDQLVRMINRYWLETHKAETGTKAMAEEQLEAAEAAKAQADAEQAATKELGRIGYASYEAAFSGENLRETYEDLLKQMEQVEAEGDTDIRQKAEQALAYLNLAATNQELATSYTLMGISAGESLSEMSQYLIDVGISVDEFSSKVTSMRDNVVNDFQSIKNENALTADEIIANLNENYKIQQQWSENLSDMWKQAYANQDTQVLAFINYLAQKGPEYAAEVQSFANAGYEKLVEASAAWGGIGAESIANLAAGEYMNQYLAEQATVDVVQGAISAAAGQDWGSASKSNIGDYANSMIQQTGSVQTATQTVVNAATGQIESSGVQFQTSGVNAGTYLKIGLLLQQDSIAIAAQSLADAAINTWANCENDFQSTGLAAAAELRGGIRDGRSDVASEAQSVATAALNAAQIDGWYSVGYNMSAGIADGVRGGSYLITNAATSAARSALLAAELYLGIESPSRVFREQVGQMIPTGIALGIQDGAKRVTRAMDGLSSRMTSSVAANLALASGGASNSSYTNDIIVNVYAAEGQDENALAEKVMERINTNLIRRSMA